MYSVSNFRVSTTVFTFPTFFESYIFLKAKQTHKKKMKFETKKFSAKKNLIWIRKII